MKSYILCCVVRVIFHSGLPHFKGGCGGSMVSLVVVSTDVSSDKLTPGMFSPPSSE